ncbi:selenide, water dikinase [Dissulfurispira thermophila]|uniref:Selenide, water dikinase n=1 Tax=Dissulfurispira thermophila TaxID=2715679 RepID=A0A7G1GZ24_9BACT|nr:selenide, water dikinase SelD [Dissulfurispira thermophila]BCB95740.1 selenide, water dikinase [Dissulfurispira thermophila]
MGPSDLEEIISDIQPCESASVLVGPGDDAGIYLLNDTAIVETVDVITPVVNDPFTFGAISANNSLSDVYAMGGKPISALAIAGFSSCDYESSVFKEILRGAVHSLNRAGAILIGGHSFEDAELKFGLSVTGVVNREKILRVSGAEEGDIIVITKPIGIGILTTSLKGEKLTDADLKTAIGWMLTLNDKASKLALKADATACTDITGFGLLGHAYNMVKDSDIDFEITMANVPVLEHVHEMIDSGMIAEGAYNNLKFFAEKVEFSSYITEEDRLLLSDPQTSGGLLITLKEENLKVFEESDIFFSVIGRVIKGSGRIVVK